VNHDLRTGVGFREPGIRPTTDERSDVSNPDEAKGRLKEAAGDLTDNDDLKREGKIDKATGSIKDKLDDAADKAKNATR
jgi:uncharacterized protein YjbJ (UPF0337 family)